MLFKKAHPLKSQKPVSTREKVRHKSLKLLGRTPFYARSLGKGLAPSSLRSFPSTPWPGLLNRGQEMITGVLHFSGQRYDMSRIWDEGEDDELLRFLHSFEWLLHLREVGGSPARCLARDFTHIWLSRYGHWDPEFWHLKLVAGRLANWVGLYDFFLASAEDSLRLSLFESFQRQMEHLENVGLSSPDQGERILCQTVYPLLLLSLPQLQEDVLHNSLMSLDQSLQELSPSLSGEHKWGVIEDQIILLQRLLELRLVLNHMRRAVPPHVTSAIESLVHNLRLLRHGDGIVALFHKSPEREERLLDALFTHSHVRPRMEGLASSDGFQRITRGRALLLMDSQHPLDCEFSVGAQRLLLAAGLDCVFDVSASALRTVESLPLHRMDEVQGGVLEGGYSFISRGKRYRHERTIFLEENGEGLRGEDIFYAPEGTPFQLEMDLGPTIVRTGVEQNRQGVLLASNRGQIWRFRVKGAGTLKILERIHTDGLYGTHRSYTFCLKGQANASGTCLKWRLGISS
ncbi:MAG: hypothetical protein GY915_04795 [bacterium]|nr:hypothetical protein [bacterium]